MANGKRSYGPSPRKAEEGLKLGSSTQRIPEWGDSSDTGAHNREYAPGHLEWAIQDPGEGETSELQSLSARAPEAGANIPHNFLKKWHV